MGFSTGGRIPPHKPSESSFIGGGSGVSSSRKRELLELAANFADLVSAAPALMRQWFRDAAAAVRVSWGCISGVGFKVNKPKLRPLGCFPTNPYRNDSVL